MVNNIIPGISEIFASYVICPPSVETILHNVEYIIMVENTVLCDFI